MRSPPVIRDVGGMIGRFSSQSAAPSAEGEGRHKPTAAVTTPSVPGWLAGCWLAFLSVLAWLILSAIILRLTTATAAAVFLGAVFLLGASEPAVLEAVAGSLLLRFFAVAQPARFIIGGAGKAAVLGVAVAVAVSFGVEDAARRTRQAAWAAAEAAR